MRWLRERWYRWLYWRFDDGNGGVKDHWHRDIWELVGLDGRVQDVRACSSCLAHELIMSYLWGWTGYVRRASKQTRRHESKLRIYGRGPYPLPAEWGAMCPMPLMDLLRAAGERLADAQ